MSEAARRPELAVADAIDPGLERAIKVDDKLPSVTLRQLTLEGRMEVTTESFFRGKKVGL